MALGDIVQEARLQARLQIRCEDCAVSWAEHWEADHRFVFASIEDVGRVADRELNASIRRGSRRRRGLLDPPLPAPAERKRIREAAGFTQADVARVLHVTPYAVYRWEKPSGYRDGERLPGREPAGELRRAYSEVLARMS